MVIVKDKKDALKLDVIKITFIKLYILIKNMALILATAFTSYTFIFLTSLGVIDEGQLQFVPLSFFSNYLAYKSITSFGNKYNTKTKWSFY